MVLKTVTIEKPISTRNKKVSFIKESSDYNLPKNDPKKFLKIKRRSKALKRKNNKQLSQDFCNRATEIRGLSNQLYASVNLEKKGIQKVFDKLLKDLKSNKKKATLIPEPKHVYKLIDHGKSDIKMKLLRIKVKSQQNKKLVWAMKKQISILNRVDE